MAKEESPKLQKSFDDIFGRLVDLYDASKETKNEDMAYGALVLSDFIMEFSTMGYAPGAKIITLESTRDKLDAITEMSEDQKFSALSKLGEYISEKNIEYERTQSGKIRSKTHKPL